MFPISRELVCGYVFHTYTSDTLLHRALVSGLWNEMKLMGYLSNEAQWYGATYKSTTVDITKGEILIRRVLYDVEHYDEYAWKHIKDFEVSFGNGGLLIRDLGNEVTFTSTVFLEHCPRSFAEIVRKANGFYNSVNN